MHKNPIGDFVTGATGGTLTAYFGLGALLVLFTGEALALGPGLPIVAAPGSGFLTLAMVRLLQSSYFAGLAVIAFLGFRVMQEILRGHKFKSAMREAATGPELW